MYLRGLSACSGQSCIGVPIIYPPNRQAPCSTPKKTKVFSKLLCYGGRRGQDRLGGRKWRRGRSTGELPGNPVDAFGLGHETLQEDGRSGIGRETEDLVRDGAIVSWAHPQRGKNKKRSNAIGERGGGGRERRGCDALTNRKMQTTLHFLFAAGAGWTTRCGWMCMGGVSASADDDISSIAFRVPPWLLTCCVRAVASVAMYDPSDACSLFRWATAQPVSASKSPRSPRGRREFARYGDRKKSTHSCRR